MPIRKSLERSKYNKNNKLCKNLIENNLKNIIRDYKNDNISLRVANKRLRTILRKIVRDNYGLDISAISGSVWGHIGKINIPNNGPNTNVKALKRDLRYVGFKIYNITNNFDDKALKVFIPNIDRYLPIYYNINRPNLNCVIKENEEVYEVYSKEKSIINKILNNTNYDSKVEKDNIIKYDSLSKITKFLEEDDYSYQIYGETTLRSIPSREYFPETERMYGLYIGENYFSIHSLDKNNEICCREEYDEINILTPKTLVKILNKRCNNSDEYNICSRSSCKPHSPILVLSQV